MSKSKKTGKGLYRIREGWRAGMDSVVLGSTAIFTVEISEHDYRELGFAPPVDDLRWEEGSNLANAEVRRVR